jgi:hypothetical protein
LFAREQYTKILPVKQERKPLRSFAEIYSMSSDILHKLSSSAALRLGGNGYENA